MSARPRPIALLHRLAIGAMAMSMGACGSGSGQPTRVEVRKYDEVLGLSGLNRQVGVCELFSWPGPIGVFRFVDITGYVEIGARGAQRPKIYVTAQTEDVWFGDDKLNDTFVFSFDGGELPSGSYQVPHLSARVGERVVMHIWEDERGLNVDTELHIFREVAPGRFSNGQLFPEDGIDLSELRQIAEQVRTNEVCPFDEDFGFPPSGDPSGRDADPHVVIDGGSW